MSEEITETRDIEFKASFRYPYPAMPKELDKNNHLSYKLGYQTFKSEEGMFFYADISLSKYVMLNTAGGI